VSAGGLSRKRTARLREVMAGYVERREVPGLVTAVCRDFWTLVYQAIDD
jgi:hypothetical protein